MQFTCYLRLLNIKNHYLYYIIIFFKNNNILLLQQLKSKFRNNQFSNRNVKVTVPETIQMITF